MFVLYLDPFFLGDPLFATQLARDVRARGGGLVLVHGSGEAGEQALEGLGVLPEAAGGVWQTGSAAERMAVERATRELNRRLAHALNEDGVAAVRVAGADRGVLRREADGVAAGNVAWLADLAMRRAVPVVAALVASDGPALMEVDAAVAAARLAVALGWPLVALGRVGVSEAGEISLADNELQAQTWVVGAEAVARAVAVGGRLRIVPPAALRASGLPDGAEVVDRESA